ncbi:MAG: hypothetical protein IT323_00805 [Anaerolineae bacterium]|nr:hypothetical protein [Anaerolineae bacterium]
MIERQPLPATGAPLNAAEDAFEPEPVEAETIASRGVVIPFTPEVILYVAFVVLAIVLRLPGIDVIPLNGHEAREALAALRLAVPEMPASEPALSQNPLMFAANTLALAIGGAENATARFPTLILGALLPLVPALFRRWIGPAQSLILSACLALSPVLLVASRRMDGAVWSAALVLLLVALAARFIETRRVAFGVAATACMALLALGAEPAGLLTLLGLLVGVGFAYLSTDDPDVRRPVLDAVRHWPWLPGLLAGGAALFVVGTVFLAFPGALSSVGESLGAGLRGVATSQPGMTAAYPLYTSILYEPVLWLFGLAGAYMVLSADPERTGRVRLFVGRALIGWLIASAAWSLVYAGAGPGHALWLTLPLAGLASFSILHTLAPVRDPVWRIPAWGPWLHGAVLVAVLLIGGINLVVLGRALLSVSPALAPALDQPDLMKLVMAGLAAALAIVTFFLAGSIWGPRGALQGIGLGLLVFLTMYSLSAGWQAAYSMASDPREPWNVRPPAPGVSLLERTLRTASLRSTGAPTSMEVVVLLPPDVSAGGPVGWALRHFRNARYVDSLTPEISAPAVIAPVTDPAPALGADYVGQDFATYLDWDRGSMTYWDFLPWLYNRQTRVPPRHEGHVVLYLRADVYGLADDAELPGVSE